MLLDTSLYRMHYALPSLIHTRFMANIKSAIKRARQNTKRNALKSSQRATTRTAVKAVLNAIEENNKDSAKEFFAKAEKTLDSMAGKK